MAETTHISWGICELHDAVQAALTVPPREEGGKITLEKACEPYKHCAGDPPDCDSPLHNVFVAGMLYSEKLLCDVVGVQTYEPGDGSEDFDCDASKSLQNILVAANLVRRRDGHVGQATRRGHIPYLAVPCANLGEKRRYVPISV